MKILLLSNQNSNVIGGVEKYNSKLIEMFKKSNLNYELLIFSEIEHINKYYKNFKEKKNIFIKSFNLWFYRFLSRKYIKKMNVDKYDLIIDSTYIYFRKLKKMKKYLWVQHNCSSFYYGKISSNWLINFLYKIYQKLSFVGDFFSSYNVVFFDKENQNEIKHKKYKNAFFSPITAFDKNEIIKYKKNKNAYKVAFFGRIEQQQKNIKLLNELNYNIQIFGDGPDIDLILDKKNIKGKYNQSDIKKIYKDIKFVVLPSNYEGFPNVAVESLSLSTPILIKNSFPSAKKLAINDDFIANDDKEFKNKFKKMLLLDDKKFYRYYNLSKKLALKYLSNDVFLEKWQRILNFFKN